MFSFAPRHCLHRAGGAILPQGRTGLSQSAPGVSAQQRPMRMTAAQREARVQPFSFRETFRCPRIKQICELFSAQLWSRSPRGAHRPIVTDSTRGDRRRGGDSRPGARCGIRGSLEIMIYVNGSSPRRQGAGPAAGGRPSMCAMCMSIRPPPRDSRWRRGQPEHRFERACSAYDLF